MERIAESLPSTQAPKIAETHSTATHLHWYSETTPSSSSSWKKHKYWFRVHAKLVRAKRSGYRNLLKYFLFKFLNLNCHLVWWLIWCIWVLLLFADFLIKIYTGMLSCFLPSSHLRPSVHHFYKDFTSSWKTNLVGFSRIPSSVRYLLAL